MRGRAARTGWHQCGLHATTRSTARTCTRLYARRQLRQPGHRQRFLGPYAEPGRPRHVMLVVAGGIDAQWLHGTSSPVEKTPTSCNTRACTRLLCADTCSHKTHARVSAHRWEAAGILRRSRSWRRGTAHVQRRGDALMHVYRAPPHRTVCVYAVRLRVHMHFCSVFTAHAGTTAVAIPRQAQTACAQWRHNRWRQTCLLSRTSSGHLPQHRGLVNNLWGQRLFPYPSSVWSA